MYFTKITKVNTIKHPLIFLAVILILLTLSSSFWCNALTAFDIIIQFTMHFSRGQLYFCSYFPFYLYYSFFNFLSISCHVIDVQRHPSIKQLCATERNPKLGNKEGSGFGDFPSMCVFTSWVVMCGWGCMVLCVCEVGIERPLGLWYEKQWHYSVVYTTLPLFAITTAVYTAFVWTTAPLQGRDCCRLHCCHPYCHLPSQSF